MKQMFSLIFVLVVQMIDCQVNSSDSILWFTSSPVASAEQQSICITLTGVSLLSCISSPFGQSCMIYSSDCGLQVMTMNPLSQSIVYFDLQTNIQVQAMFIEPNTNHLWIADSTNIYLYQIQNLLQGQVKESLKIQKQPNSGVTVTFQCYPSMNRLFVVNYSGVSVYDISNLSSLSFVFQIPAKSKTYRVFVAPNINMISLIDSTVRLIQINNPQDYNNSQKPLLVADKCSLALSTPSVLNEIVHDRYLLIQTNQQVLAGADLSTFLKTGSCSDINILTLFTSLDTYIQAQLNSDKNYLIIGINYLYIQIIEISYDSFSAQLFQQLVLNNHLYYFSISLDDEYILISNQDTIDIYARKTPNFNKIIPSIVNIPQIIVFDQFQSSIQYAYSCQYTPLTNYILSAKGTEGAYIFKEDPNSHIMTDIQIVNPPNFSTNLKYARTFNNDNNLVIGRDNNLFFYDISAINSPKLISTVSINNGNQIRSGYITQDMKHIIVAGDSQGVAVIDISLLTSPKFMVSVYQNLPIISKCVDVIMDSTEKYIFASYQYQGLVIYNATNLQNPSILSYVTTYGGYNIALFHQKNFLILADVQNGIQIIDISNLQQPVIHATIRVQGSAKQCTLIFQEQFLLCTARFKGQLQLIDLRDLSNPQLTQTFNYGDIDGGLNICVNTAQNVAYLGLISALVRVNLFPSILFDMDIILISQGSQVMNTILDFDTILKVGQTIKILLNQVYPSNLGKINSVMYYQQYKMQELPYWATFSQADSSLVLVLDKSALKTTNSTCSVDITKSSRCYAQNNTITSSQQFIFSISQKIFMTDFVNSNLGITPSISQQIYTDCILANLITLESYAVQSSQYIITSLLSSKYQQAIIDYIYYVLSERNNYYPISISVQNSLQVQIEDEKSQPVIYSISNYISVQFQVDKTLAHFISYSYSGVLIYLSAQNDWIQLEGDLDSINTIISEGIKLANYTNPENILITVTVDDSTNFIVTKTISATHKYLIQLNKPIKKNPELSLQEDFMKNCPDGEIYIMDTFNYNFNSLVFLNPDDRPLTYIASVLNGDQWEIIPQQYWLIFQSQERTFFGSTSSSQYREVEKIMLNATDGYTYAVDTFEIHISLIPLKVILQYLIQILSPIIGLLGMWRYRPLIYNLVFKQNYTTTKMRAEIGKEIVFQIPLLGNELFLAQQLWKNYYKTVNKNKVMTELNNQNTNNIRINNLNNISNNISNNNTTNNNINNSNYNNFHNSFSEESSFQLAKCQSAFQHSPTVSSHKTSQSPANKIQKQFLKKFQRSSSFSKSQKIIQVQNNNYVNQYFNSNKTINSQYILSEISQIYSTQSKIKDQHIINDLNKPNSMLSRAIIGLASIQFSLLEPIIVQAVTYLKKLALIQGYLEIDWYRNYAKIIPQPEHIQDDQFPKIEFNELELHKIFDDPLSGLNNKGDHENKISEFKFKFPFLIEVLKSISLGFTLQERGFIPKIRGECIEIDAFKISSIKAYRPIKKRRSWFSQYEQEKLVEKEFFVNQELPSWVQSLDIANNVILIKGKTETKDIGEYVLNIYSKRNFIIKQIRIIIVDQSELQKKQQEQLKQQSQKSIFLQKCESNNQVQCNINIEQFGQISLGIPQSENQIISEETPKEEKQQIANFEKAQQTKSHFLISSLK